MSKYLNVFNTLSEYQAFSASTEYVQPNVALVKETNVIYYDYGNNKPQVDMSSYKGEFQDISVGGDYFGRKAITKINYIPSGITNLSYAFNAFSSMTEVTCEIPSGVTDMSDTFSFCESLISVPNIPSGVTSMFNTFYSCLSLVSVPPIPSGVTEMSYTFNICPSLKEVTLLHTTPPKYYNTLNSSIETIYVLDSAVDAFKTATGWSQFSDKFKPLSSKPTE